jgi:hypothetical protein
MTSADEDACSSAFSSSGTKRTYSSLAVSYPLTVSSRGTIPWVGHSQAHLDPGAALRVKEMEGDALRAGGREELDRDHGQAERDVEIL